MAERPLGATVVIALVAQPAYTVRNGERMLADDYGNQLHRFRNFGEGVFTWIRNHKGTGEIDFAELDTSLGKFAVRGIRAHKSRNSLAWLGQEAERQHLTLTLELQDEQGQQQTNG